MRARQLVALATCSTWLMGGGLASAQVFSPLAEVGEAAPEVGLDFDDLDVPVIGADRDAAFTATLRGAGVDATNDHGLFVFRAGGGVESLVARTGDTLPGASAATTATPELRLMPGPRLAFRASWSDGAVGGDGVFAWSAGDAAPTALAITGADIAASGGTLRWRIFSQLRAGPSGTSVHWDSGLSTSTGGAYEDSIGGFSGDGPASLDLSMASLDPTYAMFSTHFRASPSGHWATSVTWTDATPFDRYRALVRDGVVVMRDGDMGLDVFSAIGLNDASRLLFYGGVRGGATALYAFDDGPVSLAVPGESVLPIPGTTWAPENFVDHTRILVGGGGHVAVRALLAGADAASDDAVIVFDPSLGITRAAVREGDDAPGVSGASFGRLTRPVGSLPTHTFGINASGNILVRAELQGPSVTDATRDSLWVYRYADDELTLLVRQGQPVLVDGDPYTLVAFSVQLGSGGQDGLPTGYNDAGQIALRIDLVPGEPPGTTGAQPRRIIGILEDRQLLVRIGAAPIGGLLDGGLDDAGGPTTPPSGSGPCSISIREPAPGAGWVLLLVGGVALLRRRS